MTNRFPEHLLVTLELNAWFSGRSKEFKRGLTGLGKVLASDVGEYLFRRGDENSGIYAVLEGSVRISGLSVDGKESLLTVLESSAWFGELALFDGDLRTHDAQVVAGSKLLHIPCSSLKMFLESNPEFWRDFGLLLTEKLRATFTLVEDMALLPVSDRLVKRLVGLARASGRSSSDMITVQLDQASLASMLAASRQTVNQVLKDLESKSLVELRYGEVFIPSVNRLVMSLAA